MCLQYGAQSGQEQSAIESTHLCPHQVLPNWSVIFLLLESTHENFSITDFDFLILYHFSAKGHKCPIKERVFDQKMWLHLKWLLELDSNQRPTG